MQTLCTLKWDLYFMLKFVILLIKKPKRKVKFKQDTCIYI